MDKHSLMKYIIVLTIVLGLLVGCGSPQDIPTPVPPTPTLVIVPGINEFVWANGVELRIISISEQDEYEGLSLTDDKKTLLVVTIEFGEGDVPKHPWSSDKMYLTDDIYMLTQETASPVGMVFGNAENLQQVFIFVVPKGSKGYVLNFAGDIKVPLSSLEK